MNWNKELKLNCFSIFFLCWPTSQRPQPGGMRPLLWPRPRLLSRRRHALATARWRGESWSFREGSQSPLSLHQFSEKAPKVPSLSLSPPIFREGSQSPLSLSLSTPIFREGHNGLSLSLSLYTNFQKRPLKASLSLSIISHLEFAVLPFSSKSYFQSNFEDRPFFRLIENNLPQSQIHGIENEKNILFQVRSA